MSTTALAAFVCYALAAILSIAFGIIYLFRPRFMPYHQEAIGTPWEQLDQRLQALLLGLMHTAGGGLIAVGVSTIILLLIPFRAGEGWTFYTIPVVGLITTLPALYATILIRNRTKALTPVAASAAGAGLVIIGFVLSLI